MKIVKYLFFLLLLVFIGSAIYFGTQEGSFTIENTKVIDAPLPVVFEKVNSLESWETWGPWTNPSELHFSKAEKSTGEGASIHWSGNEKGGLVTTRVIPNSEIEQEITYHTFFGERKAVMKWLFESEQNQTNVHWIFSGKHSLMDKIYFALFKKDFESSWRNNKELSLTALERVVKEDMQLYSINVDGITHYGGGYYMFVSSVAKSKEVHQKMIPMFRQVQKFTEDNNIRLSGQPLLIYNEIDPANKNIIFSAGIPVREQVITPDESPVVAGFFEPVSAVKVTLKGNYQHVEEAYSDARAFMRENGYKENPDRKIFEIFSVGEDDNLNPAAWVTEIYLPIKEKEIETLEGI